MFSAVTGVRAGVTVDAGDDDESPGAGRAGYDGCAPDDAPRVTGMPWRCSVSVRTSTCAMAMTTRERERERQGEREEGICW